MLKQCCQKSAAVPYALQAAIFGAPVADSAAKPLEVSQPSGGDDSDPEDLPQVVELGGLQSQHPSDADADVSKHTTIKLLWLDIELPRQYQLLCKQVFHVSLESPYVPAILALVLGDLPVSCKLNGST